MEDFTWLVYALGIVVAICLILLIVLVRAVCQIAENTKKPEQYEPQTATQYVSAAPAVAPASAPAPIANRKKILAAVCAVIAEENGCDVNAIRVKSFRKI